MHRAFRVVGDSGSLLMSDRMSFYWDYTRIFDDSLVLGFSFRAQLQAFWLFCIPVIFTCSYLDTEDDLLLFSISISFSLSYEHPG